jgi:hypothetical protein
MLWDYTDLKRFTQIGRGLHRFDKDYTDLKRFTQIGRGLHEFDLIMFK